MFGIILIILKSASHVFCRMPLCWNLSNAFPLLRFGRITIGTLITPRVHTVCVIYHYCLAERSLVRCLHCQVLPHLVYVLGGSHMHSPHLKRAELCFPPWKVEYLHIVSQIMYGIFVFLKFTYVYHLGLLSDSLGARDTLIWFRGHMLKFLRRFYGIW